MRLLRGVRGWLYETRSPRWRTAGLLTISLLAGGIVALGLFWGGVRSIPWMCFAGVVASWPVFVSLLRWQAAQMIQCLDTIGNARRFIIRDDAMEREVFSDTNIRYESDFLDGAFGRACRVENQGGSCTGGNSGGAAGLPILITLGLLTLGTWFALESRKARPHAARRNSRRRSFSAPPSTGRRLCSHRTVASKHLGCHWIPLHRICPMPVWRRAFDSALAASADRYPLTFPSFAKRCLTNTPPHADAA